MGIGVWENVFDWHIRHQQPLSVSRNAEGRYILGVAFTTLVLRPELSENYVGPGMDTPLMCFNDQRPARLSMRALVEV